MTDPHPKTESEIVDLLRSIDVRAPDSLHRQVETLIAARSRGERSPRNARRRSTGGATGSFGIAPRLAAGGAIAAALVAVAIAIGLSGSGSSRLSVQDAWAPTLDRATSGPPGESTANHRQLAAAVEGVSFPYWDERFGWRATGARTDHVDGRTITTIFYSGGPGRRIGYAIVAGDSPPSMSGGVVLRRDGTPYRLLTQKGAPVVTWLRNGHLCIVSGRGVSGATLLRLASWDDRGTAA